MSTYTPIASQTLGSAAASVTFSSIPQGYTNLVVVINAICASGGADVIYLQYNGDTSSGLYSSTRLVGNGSTTNSDRQTGANSIAVGLINSTVRNSDIYQIQNYSNGTTFKTCLARAGLADNQTRMTVGLWRNTNAITSLTLSHASSINFSAGSTFSIYGIQVGDKAQKAQGGNIVTSDGTYMYHAFTSSGSFTPNAALTADVLVIAGGGGGGKDKGGGGGAGGLSYQTSRSLTATTYPIIIGAAGAGSTGYTTANATGGSGGSSGSNSIFDTITSVGGGLGGTDNTTSYRNGGSGGSGGGATRDGTIGSATQGNSGGATGYGNNGGAGFDNGNRFLGGGGGGAGAVGVSATNSSTLAAGGAGLNTWSTWASATSTGVSGYYAGGGGAGGYYNAGSLTGGLGGAGGGGNAGNYSPSTVGSNAVTNTGSGGGGGGDASNGGNGGSGIVIIRYAL